MKARIINFLVYVVVRLLSLTWRVRIVGMEHRQRAVQAHPQGSFIFALWHENAVASLLAHSYQNVHPLVSRSGDGEMVAYTSAKIGHRPIRGSSSRGGVAARLEMQQRLQEGAFVAITVDGPKGPRRKVKPGVVDAAVKSGAAILPVTVVANRFWVAHRAWDKTRIPKPFAHITIYYSAPIFVPADVSEYASVQQELEQRLNADDEELFSNR